MSNSDHSGIPGGWAKHMQSEPTERAGGVREAAVEACEKQALTYLNGPARTVYGQAYQAACRDCASAIAALSPAAPAEGAVKVKADDIAESFAPAANRVAGLVNDNHDAMLVSGAVRILISDVARAALAAAPAPAVDSGVLAFNDGLEAAAQYLEACNDYGDRHKAAEIRALSPALSRDPGGL